jgi:tRNA nucleotidyltransferase (CCA-adding enzyme)
VSVQLDPKQIPREVQELCRQLADKGYRAWVVGGCLRDLLLGRTAADWDLATDALPEQVQRVFPRVLPTGIQHGTVTVRHRGGSYEVTTLRGEGAYSDGRRPDSVSFVSDIREDLSRRDFTVNALAYDPIEQTLVDPFHGAADLERRLIRAVGRAETRFSEDGLRVLRAARFCATLEFELEPSTEAAIASTLDTLRKVSGERVRDEWLKSLKAARPSRAFAVMRRSGILSVSAPQLADLPEPTWQSGLSAIDVLPGDPIVRLTALLWPLRSDRAALSDWLTRYRFSNQERERVLRAVSYALPASEATSSEGLVRRYARAVGRSALAELNTISSALAEAHFGAASTQASQQLELAERLRTLVTAETPLSQKELAVSGKELMQALALTPGPRVGQILDGLLEHVLDEPTDNQAPRLLELARKML